MTSAAVVYARREPCRRCTGMILALHFFDLAGRHIGWGALPVGPCGNGSRCGEKVAPLDLCHDDHIALAQVRARGAA